MQRLTFARDEQETVLLFDYMKGKWLLESTVRSHITKFMKKYECEITAVDENGRPTRIKSYLDENEVWFKNNKS